MGFFRPLACALPIICAVIMTHLEPVVFVLCYFFIAGFSGGILSNARKMAEEEFNSEDTGWALFWPVLWSRTLEELIYDKEEF